ncbi:MAG TPA: PKD-like family lipoprotein [Chitinophagaceae bacterium]
MNARRICQFIVFPVLAAVVLFACSKDLGNYDYDPANVITVTTDMANVDPQVVINNDSIVVKQNDSLKLNILLSQTKPSSDLSFEWLITQNIAQVANPTQHVVGNTQNLRTKILLSPNLYKLVVRVTDKATGVSFYKFYSLNVNTAPWGGEGWVVLQDQASQSDISVITTRDGAVRGTIYSNVYSLTNGSKLPGGTNKVNVINYATALRSQKVSFLYPGGGLQVRSTDFADSSVHTSWFLVTPSSFNMQLNAQANTGQYEYLINNNQLYYRRVNAATLQAPPIKFGAPVLGTWSLAPFMMNNLGSEQYFTLYDQANKCFLLYNGETGVLTPTNRPDVANSHFAPYAGAAAALHPTTGSGFDLNNIGRNLIYTENSQPLVGGTKPIYNCIFRNNANDSTFLYQIPVDLTYANNFTTGRFYLPAANNPGINTASMFASPTFLTMPGKFYYVNNNNIYICTVGTLATSTSAVGFSFPAGTVIKSMKIFKSGYAVAPVSESRVLVVATDETVTGGGHKVYFLNLTATGTIAATPADVYTGFDKIVDIAFKKGLGL